MFEELKAKNEYSLEKQSKITAIPSRLATRYRSYQCSPRVLFSDVASGAPPSRRESTSIISSSNPPSLALNLENIKIQDKKTIKRERTLIKKCHQALATQNRMAAKVKANLSNNKEERGAAPGDRRRKHGRQPKDKPSPGSWLELTAPLEDGYIYNEELEKNMKSWAIAEGRKRFVALGHQ